MLGPLEGQGLTQQQQQQQQQQWQQGADDSDGAYSDLGIEVDSQDEGEYVSMEDEGVYMDAADAAWGCSSEPKQGTAQWYSSKLTEPLWQSGGAAAQ
jgi:hypothetical protein